MKSLYAFPILIFFTQFFSLGSSRTSEESDIDLDPLDNLDEDDFLAKFGREVEDPGEKDKRSKALKRNEKNVKKTNQEFIDGKKGFFENINTYSDLPKDEFDKEKTGLLKEPHYSRGVFPLNETDEESERYFAQFRLNRESVPSSFSSVEKVM